ncbi:hypothetical protein ACTXT7_015385 [Hymenolepis weldensis]
MDLLLSLVYVLARIREHLSAGLFLFFEHAGTIKTPKFHCSSSNLYEKGKLHLSCFPIRTNYLNRRLLAIHPAKNSWATDLASAWTIGRAVAHVMKRSTMTKYVSVTSWRLREWTYQIYVNDFVGESPSLVAKVPSVGAGIRHKSRRRLPSYWATNIVGVQPVLFWVSPGALGFGVIVPLSELPKSSTVGPLAPQGTGVQAASFHFLI